MNNSILSLLLVFSIMSLSAQEQTNERTKELGVSYFGELGLRPGVELDYGLPLWSKESSSEKKRNLIQLLNLRPSFAYYFYNKNSNNFLLSAKLNYQLRFVKNANQRYFFVEPFIMAGYLSKSFLGEIYQTTSEGFEIINNAGSNSLALGSGIDFGGFVSKGMDWLLGFEYFIENTADELILHRFVGKLGVRIKLNGI